MATEMTRLQGEITENPSVDGVEVEQLLSGFLRALLAESGITIPAPPIKELT